MAYRSVEPKERIKTVIKFRTRLRSIEHQLYCLKPHIDMIREHSGRRLNAKLTPLYDLVAAWENILIKSDPIRKWQIREKLKLSKELKELENQVVDILQVQMMDEILKEPVYVYDVFLCFRGEDTRESFTSTLSSCLRARKVNIFMDDMFTKGCNLDHLLKMIEISRISIVVFSENFVDSKWCLNELEKIFQERDQRGVLEVVPVFYNVGLEELKHQTGKTKQHMKEHRKMYGKDSDIVNAWRNAINVLGNTAGFTYESGKGKPEIQLVEEIAQDISNRLNYRTSNKGRPPDLWSANKKKTNFRHKYGGRHVKLSMALDFYY